MADARGDWVTPSGRCPRAPGDAAGCDAPPKYAVMAVGTHVAAGGRSGGGGCGRGSWPAGRVEGKKAGIGRAAAAGMGAGGQAGDQARGSWCWGGLAGKGRTRRPDGSAAACAVRGGGAAAAPPPSCPVSPPPMQKIEQKKRTYYYFLITLQLLSEKEEELKFSI